MKTDKQNQIPAHVGIIMDGNRRWAKERNLPTVDGHAKGYEVMKSAPYWFFRRGVEIVSMYAFSTENWQRSREEVNYLMKLLKNAILTEIEEIKNQEYKFLISGLTDELPGDLPVLCQDLEEKTRDNTKGTINICLNYGGRSEIIEAIKKMIEKKIDLSQVHVGMLKKYLHHGELPDPDMIVRTSGEMRLSGFLLWQSSYSELMFMNKYWPDFERSDVDVILEEYVNRKRRFGGD